MHVDHVGLERCAARVLDGAVAEAADEREQGVHGAHAGPGKRRVEEPRGEAPGRLAVPSGLPLEGLHVAQRVGGLVLGEVRRVDRTPARGLSWMGLHEQRSVVEADQAPVCPCAEPLTDETGRQRVESLGDLREVVAPDFRVRPERYVIRRIGRGQEPRLLDALEVLARKPLRGRVPA